MQQEFAEEPLETGADDESREEGYYSDEAPKKDVTMEQVEEAMKSVLENLVLDESLTPKSVRGMVLQQLGIGKLHKAQRHRVKEMMDEFVQKALEDRLADEEEEEQEQEQEAEKDMASDEEDAEYADAEKVLPKKRSRLQKAGVSSARKQRKKSQSSGPPARPMSAFLFFSQEKRPGLKAAHPDLSFAEWSRKLGEMWSQLSDEEKQPYVKLSSEAKEKYLVAMEKYKEENPDASSKGPLKKKKSDSARSRLKKKKSAISTEDNAEGGPPAELSVFDKALLMTKPRRRRKDEVDLEEVDAVIPDLLERMRQAAHDDAKLQASGQPATHKMRMLDEVVREATKQRMHEFLLDKGLLRRLRDWLQILPDGSLPNNNLRTRLYDLLKILPIDHDYLSESEGLGKVLMSLWKSKRESPQNKNTLRALIEKWSRPLFRAETDYRKLEDFDQKRRQRIHKRAAHIKNAPIRTMVNYQSRHAKIPEKATFDYAVRPQSRLPELNEDEDVPSRLLEQTRQDRINKRLESIGRQAKGKTRAVSVKLTKQ